MILIPVIIDDVSRINSNMRCIEINMLRVDGVWIKSINSNMRCIEIRNVAEKGRDGDDKQ